MKNPSDYKQIDSMTARKPSCWEEIPAIAVRHDLKADLFGCLRVLECECDDHHPLDDIMPNLRHMIGQRFMLNRNNKTYYVNNEGYNYCRYICEIV